MSLYMNCLSIYGNMPPSSSPHLGILIEGILSKVGLEGRLVQQSNGNWILYDCPLWSHKASSLLHYEHPNVIVSIEQCNSSISGFIILFEEKTSDSAWIRAVVALVLASALLVTLYVYYHRFAVLKYVQEHYLSHILTQKNVMHWGFRAVHAVESLFMDPQQGHI